MNDFFTWGSLGTYSGAVLVVTMATQFFKGVGPINKIPTRIFSYIVAFVVLLAASLFSGEFTLSGAALCLVNALVVSLAANGAHEAAQDFKETE